MNLNPFRRKADERSLTETDLIDLAFGFRSLSSAFNVTQDNAVKSTAVVACLIVRAETFASLPVHVYRKSGAKRDRVSTHPLDDIIGGMANPLMTSVEFWRWKQLTEDIRGHAFVRIERSGAQPVAFWPMTNKNIGMRYDRASRIPFYDYEGDAFTPAGVYNGNDVLHFKGPLVKDAWDGTSLVDQAKVAIGLTISSEQFYERLLSKGNHFPGHLETEAVLKPDDLKAIAENMKTLAGVDHAGEMRIFDRGLKHIQNKMSVVDADLTNQQLWYLQEVCRVFRVPPSMVQDFSRSTYTNSEQSDLWFAKHTILPIAVNTESTVDRIFRNRNEADHYVKFSLDGLLRGDYKARMEGHQIAITNGVFSRNEVRELEERNPYDGGEKFLTPLNMAVDGEPVDPDPARALDPLASEKRDIIRSRRVQDEQRGRDAASTREFAERVTAPLVQAYAALGIDFDQDRFIKEALS